MQCNPRLRSPAPMAAWLLVATGLALGAQDAVAQVTGSFSDPLTPEPISDPADPPRFEKTDSRRLAQADQPTTFAPASGAGVTGFDSTNTGKRVRLRPDNRKAGAEAAGQALSPYQQPILPLPGEALAAAPGDPDAAAAGTPPVEVGPVRRPRTPRPDTPVDPYEPLGIRAGSFLLYPAIEFIAGYDSNPDRVEDGTGAAFGTVAPEVRLNSDWSRHALAAELRGSYTAYDPDSTPTLSRPFVDGRVDARIDMTRDTHLLLGGRVLVSTDNPGSPNLQAGLAELPVFATFGGSAGVRQAFNRLEVTLTGDVERTVYQESTLTDGSVVSNDDRNYDQYAGILRASYEVMPGIKPFAEVAVDQRVHDLAVDSAGFQRDSTGWTGKLGTTFELSRLLTGEIALGYTAREYEDPRLEPIEGFVGDASLIWTADALNTVTFTAASSVGESTQAGVSGVLYRDVGVQWDHSFRRWLIGTVKARFGIDDYVGDGRQDERYTVGVGLTYKVNRWLHLKGEFRQDWLNSNIEGNDYTASTVLFGVRLQQ